MNFLVVTLNLENLCQHRIQSFFVHNQAVSKINRIKITTVIAQQRTIQELNQTIQECINESTAQTRNVIPTEYKDITTTTQNRKMNIIWFNPPYSANVVTKVGKRFPSLLEKHFPPHNKFHKIFNRNIVKISYRCMLNIC